MNKVPVLQNISRLSTKEITIFILKLTAAGLLIGAVFVAPGLGIIAKYFPDADRRDRQRIKRALRYAERDGLIRYDTNNLETKAVLSHEGDVFMNEQVLFDLTFTPPKEWNGTWFVVMFDIPQRKGKVRHLLREKLLEVGFIMYQGSVYVYPYDCSPLIRDIEKILGIKDCIQTMKVVAISGEPPLKKHFQLE